MKNTGIIRKMDELGRVVIPKEIRANLDLEEGTTIEIYTREDEIIFKKYVTKQCECGQLIEDTDKFCKNCGKEL